MKNNKPTVSVIMPVYNSERYILRTIDSILKQTYTDFELIIIDDCGTDSTMNLITKVEDPRIRIIHNKQNMGIAYSRNVGIENAKGQYIALMDNDDLSPSYRFEKSIKYLESHPEIGVVGGNVITIDENDKPISNKARMIAEPKKIWGDILFWCPMANSSSMIRKTVLDETMLRYEDGMLGMEDYNFWMHISTHTKIYNFDEVFLQWRMTGSAETARVKSRKAKERKVKFAEIQKFGIIDRGYDLSQDEIDLFCKVFDENKDNKDYDLKELYIIMRKMLSQTKENHPDMLETMTYVLREHYLEAARRKGVRYMDALYCGGFGGCIDAKQLPMVSVIIPTHNRAEKIKMSINSVLNQTYENIEVIVVDDCSTDNTDETMSWIINKFPNVSYYKMEDNSGPGKTRNFGVSKSKGEYIAFHDDDDEWHPDKLELQMRKLLEDDTIDVVFSQMARYRQNVYLNTVDEFLEWDRIRSTFMKEILLDNYIGAPTIVARKSSFEKIGGFCEELRSIEDWEFAINAQKNLKLDFVPTPLMDVHVHEGSVTYNGENYAKSWVYIIKKYMQDAEDFRNEYLIQMFKHLNGGVRGRVTPKQEEQIIKYLKEALVPEIIKEPLLVDMLLRNNVKDIDTTATGNGDRIKIEQLQRYKNVAIKLMEPSERISKWLLDSGYKNIVVYGVGRLGKCLVDRIENSAVNIVNLVDRNQTECLGRKVLGIDQFVNNPGEVDVIIITPLYQAVAIGEELKNKTGIEYISVEELCE